VTGTRLETDEYSFFNPSQRQYENKSFGPQINHQRVHNAEATCGFYIDPEILARLRVVDSQSGKHTQWKMHGSALPHSSGDYGEL